VPNSISAMQSPIAHLPPPKDSAPSGTNGISDRGSLDGGGIAVVAGLLATPFGNALTADLFASFASAWPSSTFDFSPGTVTPVVMSPAGVPSVATPLPSITPVVIASGGDISGGSEICCSGTQLELGGAPVATISAGTPIMIISGPLVGTVSGSIAGANLVGTNGGLIGQYMAAGFGAGSPSSVGGLVGYSTGTVSNEGVNDIAASGVVAVVPKPAALIQVGSLVGH
jgi:hypothetical protein